MVPTERWPESVNVRQGEGRKDGGSAQGGGEAEGEIESDSGHTGEGWKSVRRAQPE